MKGIERLFEDTLSVYRVGESREKAPMFFLIEEADAEEQERMTELLGELLRQKRLQRFSGLDKTLYYRPDETFSSIKDMFYDIEDSAVYTNHFEGVIAIDISLLCGVLFEDQTEYFIAQIENAAKYSAVMLFIDSFKERRAQILKLKIEEAVKDCLILAPKTGRERKAAANALKEGERRI